MISDACFCFSNMTGIEYIVLHAQDPILYVIRKQNRHSPGPNGAVPITDYYIIAGYVYQAPDLNSIINSRLMAAVHHVQCAFEETLSFVRYHPTRGYSWEFSSKDQDVRDKKDALSCGKMEEKPKDDVTSSFQRRKVDMLLPELMKKFPPKIVPANQNGSKGDGLDVKVVDSKNESGNGKRSCGENGLQTKKQRTA